MTASRQPPALMIRRAGRYIEAVPTQGAQLMRSNMRALARFRETYLLLRGTGHWRWISLRMAILSMLSNAPADC